MSARRSANEQGTEHLREVDPVMRRLIDEYGPVEEVLARRDRRSRRPEEPYGALLRSIVGQQLSTKAARTIWERTLALFGGHVPSPEELLAIDPEKLREAGNSRPKAGYMRSLAEHVIDGELELDRLDELSDEDISAELTAVKGLGQWSADMFLIFHLGRPDVLPVGDLGVRNAAKIAYNLRKLPSPDRLKRLARPWRPYRSLASLYLWRSLDNEPA
ncbi:MAG: DNA-3-methyladenine glycosylase family protein [Thermoleophilaceae bacterium]